MNALLQTLVRLMTFRAGGDAMPHSPRLLGFLLALSIAIDIPAAWLVKEGGSPPQEAIFAEVIGLGLLYLLMRVAEKSERFVQTATALMLASMVFTLLYLPIAYFMGHPPEDPAQFSGLQISLVMPMLALVLWAACLQAWILRGALDNHIFAAFMLTLMLGLCEIAMTGALMKVFA